MTSQFIRTFAAHCSKPFIAASSRTFVEVNLERQLGIVPAQNAALRGWKLAAGLQIRNDISFSIPQLTMPHPAPTLQLNLVPPTLKRRTETMKFLVSYAIVPGAVKTAVGKFLAGEATPQEGVTLLGRWHRIDGSGGFSLYETNQLDQLYRGITKWAELLEFEVFPVLEDAEAGPILAENSKHWD
jgi:hypothetical protein